MSVSILFNCVLLCCHDCYLCYLSSSYASELSGLCLTMMVGEEINTYNLSCKTAFENERTNLLIIQNCKSHTLTETETHFKVAVHSSVGTHV